MGEFNPKHLRPHRLSTGDSDESTPAMTSSKEHMWPQTQPSASASEPPATTPDVVPEWLGNRLRTMFSEVMDEPVPDEFKALLARLDEKEKGRSS